jgi:hypothetical protein
MSRIPKDFSSALLESELDKFFADYAVSHQREYLKWIAEAKRPETREKRIQKAVKMLSDKRADATARLTRTASGFHQDDSGPALTGLRSNAM